MTNFRNLGRGKMPSGLAIHGSGNKSATEVAVGAAAGAVVAGGTLYAYDRFTSKDDDEAKGSFSGSVEQEEADLADIESEDKELKENERALDRKRCAVANVKARKARQIRD